MSQEPAPKNREVPDHMATRAARHHEAEFTGSDGIRLYRQSWVPEGAPYAVIALVHGVGEHSGRYSRIVGPLADAGIAVCSYDQRGHGRSPGPRVHINHWSEYREDLRAFLGVIAAEHPGVPVVIYGHSMGSLVVLDYLLAYPDGFAGSVISGVALEPAGVGSPTQIQLARLLTSVLPRMTVDLGVKGEQLTHDLGALNEFSADPLVTGRATVRWGTESLDTVARIKAGMDGIDLPMLVLHGADDPLNCVTGARHLHSAVAHPDNRLVIYPDTFHEPHNDLVHEQVVADVTAWVEHLLSERDSERRERG